MKTWHVNIGFKASEPFAEEVVFEIGPYLEDFAAVLSLTQDLMAGTIALTVDARTWMDALETSRVSIDDTLRAYDIEAAVTSVMVQSEEAFQEELREPVYPQVVGYAEIAKMAGVSRQRIRQLAEKNNFPRYVIRTGQGPLYSVHSVERWLESRKLSGYSAVSTKTA